MQSYYSQLVKGGIPLRLPYGGMYFLLDDAGAARKVDVTLEYNSQTFKKMPGRVAGFLLPQQFDAVTFESPTDTVVAFFATNEPAHLGATDGLEVSIPNGVLVTNTALQRVPVDVGGAVIDVTATNVTIDNGDASPIPVKLHAADLATKLPVIEYQAAAAMNAAPVAIDDTLGGVELVAADATRRGLRLRNAGLNAIALIAAGGTYANAAVIIQPGETWNENEAPGAAWYGICDAGLTTTINIQSIA